MEKQILKSGYNVVGKRVYTMVSSSQIINPLFRKLYEMDDLNETQILRLIQTEYKPVRVRTNKDLKPSEIIINGVKTANKFDMWITSGKRSKEGFFVIRTGVNVYYFANYIRNNKPRNYPYTSFKAFQDLRKDSKKCGKFVTSILRVA